MKKTTLMLDPIEFIPRAMGTILGHDVVEIKPSDDVKRTGHVDIVVGSPEIWTNDPEASDHGVFIDAVREHRPETFVLEAVRGLASPRNLPWLFDLIDDLSELGYTVAYDVIKFGGARSTVVVGIRDGAGPGPQHQLPSFEKARQTRDGDPAVRFANLVTENLRRIA